MDSIKNNQGNSLAKIVHRGVLANVTVTAEREPITSTDSFVSNNITPRPLTSMMTMAQMLQASRNGATPQQQTQAETKPYEVKQGDTLFKILRASGFSEQEIKEKNLIGSVAQMNNIPNPDKIQVGQKLQLPTASKVAHSQKHQQASKSKPVIRKNRYSKPVVRKEQKGGNVETSMLNVKNQPKPQPKTPSYLSNPLLPKYEDPFTKILGGK